MRLGDDGSWRMYNIIINGINIGLTYRNQFASAMKAPENNGSLDAVINGWGETIANVDPATQGDAGERQRRRVMVEVTSTDRCTIESPARRR